MLRRTVAFAVALTCTLLSVAVVPSFAQTNVDANTLLLLRFENSLNGEQGEAPTQASGHSFQPGIQGQGALLASGTQIFYSSNDNINATEGTIEFWIKPTWSGNDNQGYILLTWGSGGGIVVAKDGANNLRIILNRFGTAPGGEKGVATNIESWQANEWHFVAFTYSNTQKRLDVFVDGSLKSQATFTGELPAISSASFQLGADGSGGYANSIIDEFRISNTARTAQEIAASFFSSLTVSSLTASPNTLQMLPTWWKAPSLQATTNIGTISVPPVGATWNSSNSAVATFDLSRGKIIAHAAGTATLTATLKGTSANISVTVTAPVLQPVVESISPHLSNPRPEALWEMPVVIISYLPTKDGVNVDSQVADWTQSLTELRQRIDRIDIQHKFMLEEGSRFRAFSNPAAKPSLGYRVIHHVTVFEEMPTGFSAGSAGAGAFFPDYEQILTRFNAQNFVNNLGVKEFWIWGYHHGNIVPVESNMSSPTTGDISNSFRHDDLPVFNSTYVLYNYNFTRTAAEATHNHGHQLEAILAYVNQRQDSNTQLFWQKFVGRAANGVWQRGRAGDTHHPPNALDDYDYSNTTPFPSDIADWNPNGGVTQPVSLATWRSISYPWPDGIAPPSDDAWWYIYWFQSMPGRGNSIPDGANRMTNWWQFTADWDAAIRGNLGLHEPASCSFSLSSTSQQFAAAGGTGSVSVSTGNGCSWVATSNAPWVRITSGQAGNSVNITVNFTVDPNTNGHSRMTTLTVAGIIYTITQAPLGPVLITDGVTQKAAALDSVTFLRDPFPLSSTYNFSADQRTRLMLFAANVELAPGESISVVTAQAEDSQQRVFPLTVEFVGKVPAFNWLTQVNVKLPIELANAGDVWVSIKLRGVVSNRALISIRPSQ